MPRDSRTGNPDYPGMMTVMLSVHDGDLAVVARFDRATQYSRGAVIEPRSRGVLDAPVKPGHDTVRVARPSPQPPADLLRKTVIESAVIGLLGRGAHAGVEKF